MQTEASWAPDNLSTLNVLVFYSPVDATESVLAAVFEAGAGAVGNYDQSAFISQGTGQFRPLAGANPAIGEVGALTKLDEHRVEVTFPAHLRKTVVAALRKAHPYEEPAFHVVSTV